jgi:hypothetical protein
MNANPVPISENGPVIACQAAVNLGVASISCQFLLDQFLLD